MLTYNKNLKQRAQELRDNMTDAEKCLWAKLRMRQLNGIMFYRQTPIGEYIVDFYCPKAKLAIEVDGGQHFTNETAEYDRIRNEYLNSVGLRVLRFTNEDVLKRINSVAEKIESEL
ncbi:MAG: endonuclease domain-containing protein [Dehalococcoidales bacterium]|nr:endonuclease domain-containing protein [Dehalococcoidales bacterium]